VRLPERALACLVLALVAGCSLRDLSDLEGGTSGDAGAAGSSGSDAGAAGVSGDCAPGSTELACVPLLSDTAYLLHPATEPTRCVTLATQSHRRGEGLVEAACEGNISQKLWVVAETAERVSLRSAWSGLCLQPLASHTAPGSVVVQDACLGLTAQLWSVVVTESGVRLVHAETGLLLDVAEEGELSQLRALILGSERPSATLSWQFEPVEGGHVTLAPESAPDGFLSKVQTQAAVIMGDDSAGRFRVLPGLAEPTCISLESQSALGSFLRHSDYLLWVDPRENTAGFNRDATFCLRDGKSEQGPGYFSLEALNYPDYYVTQSAEGQAELETLGDTRTRLERATFRLRGR